MKINVTDFINFCSQINSRNYNDNACVISPEKLNELKLKSEDPNLYLGIVGEFNAGKSTLINAILRQNLLKEDILQGVTCTPTFIQYGKDFDIVVKYANGKTFSFKQEHPDYSFQAMNFDTGPVRNFIDQYTAEEKYASTLDRVTIFLDNPILQNNFVIIDTPGINSNIIRHSTVTKQTLEKHCDAAIIMTPANAPCSETLCSFVKENLHGLENRCLGIVSKIDSLRRANEQDGMVDFVKTKFETELESQLAAVVPVSAIYSQGQNENEVAIKPELAERYKKMFADFERTIHERLIKGREGILAQNMRESVMEMVAALQKVLEKRKNDLSARQEILKNSQLTDIDSFKDNLIEDYKITFQDADWIDFKEAINSLCESAKDNIESKLYKCQSADEIKNFVKKKLEKRCKKAVKKVVEKLNSIQENLSRWSEKTCKDFQKKFSAEFRNLSKGDKFSLPEISSIPTMSSDIDIEDVSFDDETFTNAVFSGIATGIATFIAGPCALLLFPFLMYLWGDGLDKKKDETWEKMEPVIDECFDDLKKEGKKSYKKLKNKIKNATFQQINNITEHYKPTIIQIIENEKAELNKLRSQQNAINRDMKQLHQFEVDFTDF